MKKSFYIYQFREISQFYISDMGKKINKRRAINTTVESLQSHFILTMSHWSSGLTLCFPSQGTWVGCPRNNQIFFSVRTETNRNSICFSCFSVCFAKPKNFFFGLFRFVSVFRTSIETTETNRIFSKQTEINQKNPPKNVIY